MRRLLYPHKDSVPGSYLEEKGVEKVFNTEIAQTSKSTDSNPASTRGIRRVFESPQKEVLVYHCGAVFISFWCYIIAFILIGSQPTRGDQIARVCLWYPPVILEIIAHFVVATKTAGIRWEKLGIQWMFEAPAVHARRTAIFTIILGAGLDRMTDNFHFMIGNLS